MKHSLVVILLANAISQQIYGQRPGVCSVCRCLEGKVVACDRLRLTSSFEPSAWRDIAGPNSTYTEINLNDNHIGHVTAFPPLNITKLSLRNNRIVKIDDGAFWNLTKLLYLDLSENELGTNNFHRSIFRGHFSVEYYEPLPIRHLDLSGNEFHSLNILIFEHLPHVRRLILRKNPFKMLDKSTVVAISGLQEMEVLDLSYTQLRELPVGFLHSIKSLKELNLAGNYLKEVPSNVLYESHNLNILNLGSNPIKVISTERPFPEMPSLRVLEMSEMPELVGIEPYSMSGLKGLECFHCRDNRKLEFVSSSAFAANENDTSRPNITTLDLKDNALHHLNRTFLHIEKLKFINLIGNNWSCDCDNQWMVSELVPILLNTHNPINGLTCSEPAPMKGKHFLHLYKANYQMRCLDYYGNDPENDSVILITVFSIIIAVMGIGLIVIWKAKFGSCRRGDRPDYSRAFYKPARSDEKY